MDVKKSSLYTRTGDNGLSSLYTGERVSKANIIFEVLGDLDELNAGIGCIEINSDNSVLTTCINSVKNMIEDIQNDLLDIGSCVATMKTDDEKHANKIEKTKFSDEKVKTLERRIDFIDAKLPPLKVFILPKGNTHMSRAICRRAERHMVALNSEMPGQIPPEVLCYINRLSDFLFALARLLAQEEVRHTKK